MSERTRRSGLSSTTSTVSPAPLGSGLGIFDPISMPLAAAPRQIEINDSAVVNLTVDRGVTARLLHKSINARETDARAVPAGLVVKKGSKARAMTSGGMPDPYPAPKGKHSRQRLRPYSPSASLSIETDVASGKREPAALRHGVSRIDGEVQYRILNLARIDAHRPQAGRKRGCDLDGFTERSAQQGPSG